MVDTIKDRRKQIDVDIEIEKGKNGNKNAGNKNKHNNTRTCRLASRVGLRQNTKSATKRNKEARRTA